MLLLRDRERDLRKSEFMEWELRHSARPPSASCFGIFLACGTGERGAGDCRWADCTELYKSESNVGQTTENAIARSKVLPSTVRRAERAGVSSSSWGMVLGLRDSDLRFGSFRKTERETTISPVLGRSNRPDNEFVRIWRTMRFGTLIALFKGVRGLRAVTRSRAANVQR
jgi:hypothetical protein